MQCCNIFCSARLSKIELILYRSQYDTDMYIQILRKVFQLAHIGEFLSCFSQLKIISFLGISLFNRIVLGRYGLMFYVNLSTFEFRDMQSMHSFKSILLKYFSIECLHFKM